MKNLKELAQEVAIEAKLFNCTADSDFGFLYEDDWNLSDAEWKEVCDEAAILLPTVEPTKEQLAFHSQAMRGFTTTDPIYSDA